VYTLVLQIGFSHTNPLLMSTGFLKYPLELKKKIVTTEKKNQLVYTDFFSIFFSSNLQLKKKSVRTEKKIS
jgi:hypothetical protein